MKKIILMAAMCTMAVCSCNKNIETDDPQPKPNLPGGNTVGLVFNEVCASEKYVELYNSSDAEVVLTSVTIVKYDSSKEGGKSTTWTGAADMKLAPKAWIYLESSDLGDEVEGGDPNYVYQSVNHIFIGGLSGKKNIKFELLDADGNVLDTFIRGIEGAGWNQVSGYTNNKKASFSRVPDGTGEWVYAAPTKGAANGEKTGDIENEPAA